MFSIFKEGDIVELLHYGVKGMQWGHRKDKGYTMKISEDGELIIRKGSNIHRVTSNEHETNSGHKYASFTEKDVLHYNKAVTSWLTEASNDYKNVKTFDMTLKVKDDLIAPSEKKKVETFIKLLSKDRDVIEEINKCFIVNISDDDHKLHRFDVISKKFQKSGMDESTSQFYSAFSLGLNYSESLRTKFFGELSKEGYNMIVDTEDAKLEAQAPIIVFDGSKSLKVLKTKELPKKYSPEWTEMSKKDRLNGNLNEDARWKNIK